MFNLTVLMHLKTYQNFVTLLSPFQTCPRCHLLPDEAPHQLQFRPQLDFNFIQIFQPIFYIHFELRSNKQQYLLFNS